MLIICPHPLSPPPSQHPVKTRKGDMIQADHGAYGTVSCFAKSPG
jgi:hypothetical protein